MPSTFDRLRLVLSPLWRTSNELFQALCTLHEVTRITVALQFYANVVALSDESAYLTIIQCSQELATIILAKILTIFDDHPRFEDGVRPRTKYQEYFVSFFNTGPSNLDPFLYFYGLLDCVSQLSKILSLDRFCPTLSKRMKRIVASSQEPSYRWKAVSSNARLFLQAISFEIC